MTTSHVEALSFLALAQPEVGATAAPAGAPPATGGADMMGGSAPTSTPGTTAAPGGPPAGRPQGGIFDSGFTLIILMVGMLVLMMWSASRRQKKEQTQRQNMMSGLAKGDVVVTIGGIKGTIVEDPTGKDEIVLMVDELTRNRIRFVKTAVSSVVRDTTTASSAVEAKAEGAKAAV